MFFLHTLKFVINELIRHFSKPFTLYRPSVKYINVLFLGLPAFLVYTSSRYLVITKIDFSAGFSISMIPAFSRLNCKQCSFENNHHYNRLKKNIDSHRVLCTKYRQQYVSVENRQQDQNKEINILVPEWK